MPKNKVELINDIREIFSALDTTMTSARLASSAYDILDLLIKMNTIEPGCCRKEIVELSRTIGNEVSYAHEIAKDIYLKNVADKTEIELIAAKKIAINKIGVNISSVL
jgi:hypothetical protein